MSFKPSNSRNRRPDRTSLKARANVDTVQTPQDEVYNMRQHENEIVRAENKAHGLAVDTDLESAKAQRLLNNETVNDQEADHRESPAQNTVTQGEFEPVDLPDEPASPSKRKFNGVQKNSSAK